MKTQAYFTLNNKRAQMSWMDWGDEEPTDEEIIRYYRTSAAITKCYLRWIKKNGKKFYEASESAGNVKVSMTGKERSGMSEASKPEKPMCRVCGTTEDNHTGKSIPSHLFYPSKPKTKRKTEARK